MSGILVSAIPILLSLVIHLYNLIYMLYTREKGYNNNEKKRIIFYNHKHHEHPDRINSRES